MTSKEIELNLAKITENLNPEEFIYDFLLAFGISKTSVARVKKGDFNMSKVEGELLYKGKIFFKKGDAGSMKSESENLANDERILKQNPRFIILTDYENLVAKDLKTKVNKEFPIAELSKHFAFFLPLTGAEIYKSTNDNKADRDASYELAKLYDILIEDNAELLHGNSHQLNIFLSRLLFCFFAEDTGIFETEGMFSDAIANHTKENGSDVLLFFTDLFQKLNTKSPSPTLPKGERATKESFSFPAYISDFPYVNGGLFRDDIICPKFSRKSREILLNCGNLNWDEINPDIFGSMIQAVADPEERSDLGMHYTSVPNILKLIKPLFLDELYEEFEKNMNNSNGLRKLLQRISKIKFFDPACGSGNFLIITYKELRALEVAIIKQLIELNPGELQLYETSIQLKQFYGIEIKDFAHEMAMLSLWLSEHQMNKYFEDQLTNYAIKGNILPLKESGKIVCGNAARMDWEQVCPKKEEDEIYVIGNPPYLGSNLHSDEQREEMKQVFGTESLDRMDYIGTWFLLGANYIYKSNAKCAFVSTNSITQGVQVPILWNRIFEKGVFINFAVKSFKWTNNAKKNAGVSVIIIGLSYTKSYNIRLFDNLLVETVKSIGPYLIKNNETIVMSASIPLNGFPPMNMGNKPADDGNLILDEVEAEKLITEFPNAKKFLRKFSSADDIINGKTIFCLWIEDNEVDFAKSIPPIKLRTEKLRKFREESKAKSTRDYSSFDYKFRQICFKDTDGIVVPRVSSERRDYIPLAYIDSNTIVSDATNIIYDAQPWLFGVLQSKMHMVWVDAVGGKLETRYRYSAKLCYNTFPFPEITEKDKHHITQYVFAVLDERSKFPEKTMAWLYNPETMPRDLKKAHQELDLAIERIYRLRPFESDAERLEFLFKMYDEMTKRETLWSKGKKTKKQQ